jgi:hypothetical protein
MIPKVETVQYLNQLKGDLKTFTPDQVEMVKAYLPKTHLRTRLVDVVSALRLDLITKPDQELTGKFKQLKNDLVGHIDRRILRLNNPQTCACIDPWIALERRTSNPALKNQCEDASTHIEDVLFTCSEVIDKGMQDISRAEAQEVSEFRTSFLPRYLEIIQLNSEQTTLEKPIQDGFQKLEAALKLGDFTSAKQAAQAINTSLAAYAMAVTKI